MSEYYFASIPEVVATQPVYTIVPPYYSDNNLYGYNLLAKIYGNILEANKYQPTYNLSPDIRNKLDRLKTLEQEINDALKNAERKQELQIASYGQIDPNIIPNAYFSNVLNKHENLLGITSDYNTQFLDLTNTLQKINRELISGARTNNFGYNISSGITSFPGTALSPINQPWSQYW